MKANRFYYILSLVLVWFILFILGEEHMYPIFYALILLPVFSLLSLLAAPGLIKINETADKTDLYKNEPLRYKINITVKGKIPYPALTFSFYNETSAWYTPVSQNEYVIIFPYRGEYEVGIERFYVTDFCGLFKFGFKGAAPLIITVFPEIVAGFTVEFKNEPRSQAINSSVLLNDNQADAPEVRKYTPTDDYKKIHWKLAAKRNELIVKEYLAQTETMTYIFLDTKAPALTGADKLKFEDRLVSYALTAAYSCANRRSPAALCLTETSNMNNRGDMDIISRALAKFSFTDQSALMSLLKDFSQKDGLYNLIIFITGIGTGLFGIIDSLKRMGHNIAVYYAHNRNAPPDDTARAALSALQAQGVVVEMLNLELGE